LGNTLLGIVCGLLGYYVLRRILERRAAAHAAQPAPEA